MELIQTTESVGRHGATRSAVWYAAKEEED